MTYCCHGADVALWVSHVALFVIHPVVGWKVTVIFLALETPAFVVYQYYIRLMSFTFQKMYFKIVLLDYEKTQYQKHSG